MAGKRRIQKGEQTALTHGGYARIAQERLDEETTRIMDALAADAPVYEAADGLVVQMLAEAICRYKNVRAYIARYGEFDERRTTHPGENVRRAKRKGKPTKASADPWRIVEVERELRSDILKISETLGMTPTSRAKLGLALGAIVKCCG